MIYLLLIFSTLHVLFYLLLLLGWYRIPSTAEQSDGHYFSIIVPVRNEEIVIEKLLTCLAYQQYDKSKYEVIVVDDWSMDKTVQKVRLLQESVEMNLRLIQLKDSVNSGKKRALTKGVENASYDFIITTDADCQMGPHWLASYAAQARKHKFIAGPVTLKGEGVFASLQQVEFAGLIGFGAATMSNNNPSMCSGANLGFDKSAFFEVGGYSNNIEIPSGDDEFLLYNIQKKFPGKVAFIKNKSAIVVTKAHSKISDFFNQRTRWISKWKYNKNPLLRLITVLFFCDYLILYSSFYFLLSGAIYAHMFFGVLVVRWLANSAFIYAVHKFLGHKKNVSSFLIFQIIYPIHVLFMGVNSIFGRYTWKGRKY